MPRPSRLDEKRRELTPVVARAFAELGYRRASTAELARRCGVAENILYRLWPDKKAMFIAAIDHVYDRAAGIWAGVTSGPGPRSGAERLLDHEAKHVGEPGHARIVFAGLSELDDPDIRAALARMYQRYQAFVREQVRERRRRDGVRGRPDAGATAWAFLGLGTVTLIARELDLLSDRDRTRLMAEVGRKLLG